MAKLAESLKKLIAEGALQFPMGPAFYEYLDLGRETIAAAESLEKRCTMLEDQVRGLELKLGEVDDLEAGICPECRLNPLEEQEMVCGTCFGKEWLGNGIVSDSAEEP